MDGFTPPEISQFHDFEKIYEDPRSINVLPNEPQFELPVLDEDEWKKGYGAHGEGPARYFYEVKKAFHYLEMLARSYRLVDRGSGQSVLIIPDSLAAPRVNWHSLRALDSLQHYGCTLHDRDDGRWSIDYTKSDRSAISGTISHAVQKELISDMFPKAYGGRVL